MFLKLSLDNLSWEPNVGHILKILITFVVRWTYSHSVQHVENYLQERSEGILGVNIN